MGKWISTVTNKGYALQAKLLSTDKLNITRVVSGSGSCAVTQLINQTAVSDIKQELIVDSLSYDKYGNARLNVTLSNIDLNTGYDVNQIGIYATDPDEGEILYAISQADESEPIPSISEQPNGFYCSWDFALTYSNAQNINVTIDPSNAISREAADLRYVQLAKIGDNLSVDENGVLSADAQEITVDDKLSSSSTNPVQNKVVNTALGNKVDKVTGKGLSSNDYTTDEKNKLSGIAAGANKYTHPSHDAHTTGLYKVEVDSKGHVVSATEVKKDDITALGIPSTNTTYSLATTSSNGLMSSTDKSKIDGIEAGANKTTVDSALSSSSTNPVQNKAVNTALGNKVDKVSGKGLSTNDYTTAEKNKLSAISNVVKPVIYPASGGYRSVVLNSNSAENAMTGNDELVFGESGKANGRCSVAGGCNAEAHGEFSFAYGFNVKANARQIVLGAYNEEHEGRPLYDSIYEDDGTTPATSFIIGVGIAGNFRANALRVTADGQARGLKAFLSSGADFAEYMEWEDGNPDNEDRRGRMVAYALTDAECVVEEIEILDPVTHEKKTIEAVVRDKMPPIRYATSFDECIGVVSSSGAFIGNSASEEWNSQYVRDIFGEKIVQAVLIPEETKTYNTTEIDEETGEEVIVEKTEVIPEHWVNQYVLNPHYDPEAEYIEREHRKEWSPVGFHGQIVAVDDGTCVVGGYCSPAENGIATASETGFRVIQRLDKKHVRLYVE